MEEEVWEPSEEEEEEGGLETDPTQAFLGATEELDQE